MTVNVKGYVNGHIVFSETVSVVDAMERDVATDAHRTGSGLREDAG